MAMRYFPDGVIRADADDLPSVLGRQVRLVIPVAGADELSADHLLDSVWVEKDGEVTFYLDLPAEFGRAKNGEEAG